MSSWATSAMRRSRSVFEARSTAALAAFSQESVLVPTSSMILYTLSAMAGSFLAFLEGAFLEAAFIALARRLEQPGRAHAAAAAEEAERPHAERPGALGRHDEGRRGAVRELGGVAGRHRAALLEGGGQLGEALERGVGAVALVAVDDDLLARLLARRLVGHLHGGLHGRDLVLELALPLRGGGALLGEERVAVLRLAAHLVALGHDLGGLAHGHVDRGVVVLEVRVEEVRLVEVVL